MLREVLSHNVNALLVPPHEIDAWVRAVERLGRDAVLRERLATRAFEDVSTKYTWEQRAKKVLEGLGS